MYPDELLDLTTELIRLYRQYDLKIATAESCTGGLIAGCLTAVAGSSEVFERGFNTYSNEAKSELLGIPPEIIAENGAVSQEVAIAMAESTLARAPVDLTVSVTGIAGPGGGSSDKPVGTVHLASAFVDHPTIHECRVFPGDRNQVRMATVKAALDIMLRQVSN